MIDNLIFRKANDDDIEFVIEAIIESEKSGSDMVSSCKIFNFTENEFKNILKEILLQDIPNYDYYLSGFLIAEFNGEKIGTVGSWLEAADGTASGMVKATVLFQYLGAAKFKEINKNTKVIKGLTLNREPGTLQLEHGYTKEKFRRQSIFTNVIKRNIKENLQHHNFSKVQGILFNENYKSFKAHLKLGYNVVEEKKVEDPEILKYFPYNSKVLMELSEENFQNF
jgi:hypothetical protein